MTERQLVAFETVTVAAAVAAFPAASLAVALNVCDPSAVEAVFQAIEYGADVTSTPRLTLSNLNCTPTTPTLSEAEAEIATVPDTVAPGAGALHVTVGRVVSVGGGADPASCLTV